MGLLESWPNKWFGVWKEQGAGFENCPSLKDFINVELVKEYNFSELFWYLEDSQTVATTSGDSFPDPFTGELIKESISYKTDGRWLWLDSLPYYIEKYKVAIPIEFFNDIMSNKCLPVKWSGDIQSLDWPN
jgi:hypothetical protein